MNYEEVNIPLRDYDCSTENSILDKSPFSQVYSDVKRYSVTIVEF